MGHEIITYRSRAAIIPDDDFEAIRHFLLIESEALSLPNLAAFVRGWNRVGSGVWIGEDFDAYFHGDEVLEGQFLRCIAGARMRLQQLGELVPLEYIKMNIDSDCIQARPVVVWLTASEKLAVLFAETPQKMNPKAGPLIDVFREARSLLARHENDFAWSSWEDSEAALSEIDAIVCALEAGKIPEFSEMQVLFAATGPIQEVSLSSGWSEEFLHVAARFDAAVKSL